MNTLKLVKDRIDHERKGRNFHYKDTQDSVLFRRVSGNVNSINSVSKKKDLDAAFAGNRGFNKF